MADAVMLLFVFALTLGGWKQGLVRRLAGLGFFALSFVLGSWLQAPAGAVVHVFFPKIPQTIANVVGYSIAFSLILVAFNAFSSGILSRVGTGGWSKATNKVLGAIVGFVEAILILSAAIVILHAYSAADLVVGGVDFSLVHEIRLAVDHSTIGKLLEGTTVPLVLVVLGPLLPTDLKTLVPTQFPGGIPGFPIPAL
jgi:uncharacterized membrane protein required for colicin V production